MEDPSAHSHLTSTTIENSSSTENPSEHSHPTQITVQNSSSPTKEPPAPIHLMPAAVLPSGQCATDCTDPMGAADGSPAGRSATTKRLAISRWDHTRSRVVPPLIKAFKPTAIWRPVIPVTIQKSSNPTQDPPAPIHLTPAAVLPSAYLSIDCAGPMGESQGPADRSVSTKRRAISRWNLSHSSVVSPPVKAVTPTDGVCPLTPRSNSMSRSPAPVSFKLTKRSSSLPSGERKRSSMDMWVFAQASHIRAAKKKGQKKVSHEKGAWR